MKMKLVYSAVALFVMCNQSTVVADEEQSDFSEKDVKPIIVLGYKPIISFYYPVPFTLGQLVPAGSPWPDSPEGYRTTLRPDPPPSLVNKLGKPEPESPQGYQTSIKPTLNDIASNAKPATVLEYKPTRPSFLAEPTIIGQLIPSGTPWPDSPQGYSTTLKPPSQNKFETYDNKITQQKPATVLEYQPTKPSFLPEPSVIAQPSGTPSPDSPQGYSTTLKPPLENKFETDENKDTNQKPATVLGYKPTRPSFLPEPFTIGQLIPPGKPWPASVDEYNTSTSPPQTTNRFPEVTSKKPTTQLTQSTSSKSSSPTTHIVLEYKPQRPWYVPDPVTIGQIVPTGKPWPASVDEYNTSTSPSQITNHVPEVTSSKPTIQLTQSTSSESSSQTTHIVLGYNPQRPGYVPDPVTIGQIVPTGKPWPASVDGYNTSRSPSQITTTRVPEVTSSKPTIQVTQSTSSKSSSQTTHIVLGYNPQRPGYAPVPVTIGQIVPTGKPWPASAEGYLDFSAGKPGNSFRNQDENVTNSLP